jgi:hypothetical protein
MSPKRSKPTRKLRGAQKWILAELQNLAPSATMATAKLAKRISKASGKAYHKNSVYLALRSLASRGEIKAVRNGNQKSYQIADRGRAAGMAVEPKAAGEIAPVPSPQATETAPHLSWPERVAHDAMLPHKLALGEILVLSVSDGHVLAATNLHGRLVFERYPL